MARDLLWLKRLILPAAKAHAARKSTALAVIAAAVSGFKWVKPVDLPAQMFRYVLLLAGAAGVVWLIVLLIFPPEPKR